MQLKLLRWMLSPRIRYFKLDRRLFQFGLGSARLMARFNGSFWEKVNQPGRNQGLSCNPEELEEISEDLVFTSLMFSKEKQWRSTWGKIGIDGIEEIEAACRG